MRDAKLRQVQVEYLSPAELDAALAAASIVYLPLGTIEFHGSHLPVGLDALTAHGLCIDAAQRTGGLVLPPLYQGTGGGHSAYPWTIMMPTATAIRSNVHHTLQRLSDFGVRKTVLFTGHFPDEQLDLIDGLAAEWNTQGTHTMRVLATGVNRCTEAPLAPDHAGVFETTLLHSFWPDLVHLDRLPPADMHPAVDPAGDDQGRHRHDSAHPLWGIFGPDPRRLDLSSSGLLREFLVGWLSGQVLKLTA
ncbi:MULTISPECIES: creatininase family protein [unclassified Cryobacterium]|uniref:creatininase family protein n=1 Tax=unclassified Cryobacterium TaxID=2649013 RepID=UPI000CE52559|nr:MULTISPECIES: creatininase family protein [unclassified Cryobacterium]